MLDKKKEQVEGSVRLRQSSLMVAGLSQWAGGLAGKGGYGWGWSSMQGKKALQKTSCDSPEILQLIAQA